MSLIDASKVEEPAPSPPLSYRGGERRREVVRGGEGAMWGEEGSEEGGGGEDERGVG